jgi:hypothetical protein
MVNAAARVADETVVAAVGNGSRQPEQRAQIIK